VLLDQEIVAELFEATHDTKNPDTSKPTTLTYPDSDEIVSSHLSGLFCGAVTVFEPLVPIHL
jgi:hypothetical protein